MDYDSFLDLARHRRTIRRFRPDPVPDEDIDKIIEAARWAPSGFNMQPWDFVIVKDADLKRKISGWLQEYHRFIMKTEATREPWQQVPHHPSLDQEADYKSAPVYIILLEDTRTTRGLPTAMLHDMERRLAIQHASMANAYLYMALAATTLGLANEWISSSATAMPQMMIRDLLNIPDCYEIFDMMAVGYPAYKLGSRKLMRDKATMVHRDICTRDEFRTDDEVNDFIRRARIWTTANHRRGIDKRKMG